MNHPKISEGVPEAVVLAALLGILAFGVWLCVQPVNSSESDHQDGDQWEVVKMRPKDGSQ